MLAVSAILFFSLYGTFTLWLVLGWNLQKRKSVKSDLHEEFNKTRISILIPCRNEAQTIGNLLHQLESRLQQEVFEIICIDDHSTDDTDRIIKQVKKVRYLSLPDQVQGKKAALEEGVRQASGDIILITDADCMPDIDWVSKMIQPFALSDVHMVCGWVSMRGRGDWFSELVSLEFSTLVATSAAMNGWNKPVLCNGASLAFRKESFVRVGGYSSDKSASGDDVFLLHKFKVFFGNKSVHYMLDPQAGVTTDTPGTFQKFIHQRVRWARKSILYKDADTIILSLFILAVHGWLLGLFLASWFEPDYWMIFGLSWLGKTVCDVFWVATYSATLKQKHWIGFVLPLCMIHWLYIPLMACYAQLAPKPEWKGRIWKY